MAIIAATTRSGQIRFPAIFRKKPNS